jgi:hypothetical protein
MVLAKGRTCLAVLLAGLVFCLLAAPAQAQTTLRYKFKQGETLNYELQQKMDMKMSVAGKDIAMAMNQNIGMTWKVLEVDASGKARISQKMDRIKMTMEGPAPIGKMEYDSKDSKEPEGPIGKMLGPVFNALAGAEFTVSMDPRGELSDVKLPEKLADTLKNVAGQAPGMGDMFSPDGLKRMINQGGLVLPEKAVTKGDTWTQKIENKMPFGTMKVVNTLTYEGTDQDLQRIQLKPAISLDPDPAAPINLKVKGADGKGMAKFDNTAGRLVEMNLVQNMDMAIGAGGQDITQNIRTTTVLKLKTKGD